MLGKQELADVEREPRSRSVLFVQGGGEGTHDSWDDKLVASLQRALGRGYTVRYPRMPDEANPDAGAWKKAIDRELRELGEGVILVGHSIGAAVLIDYLADGAWPARPAGVFLIATPFIGDGGWPSDDLRPTVAAAAALADAAPLYLYQGRDDETVPPAHLDLFAQALPRATTRALEGRNHQLNDDLADVARDIVTALDQQLLEKLQRLGPSLVAVEALWDGDSTGWFVSLAAVVVSAGSYESRSVKTFSGGSDLRVINGAVPPWPEAAAAAAAGQGLAGALGVPFHFPSPDHPEDDCPHWWQLAEAYPCRRCGIALRQPSDLPWRGVCYYCHLALESEAREARLSPEERAGPRCQMCGAPAPDAQGDERYCAGCRAKYRWYTCAECGSRVQTSAAQDPDSTICVLCLMKQRLAGLPAADRLRLRQAATLPGVDGIIEARDVLGCGINDARMALHVIAQEASGGEG